MVAISGAGVKESYNSQFIKNSEAIYKSFLGTFEKGLRHGFGLTQ